MTRTLSLDFSIRPPRRRPALRLVSVNPQNPAEETRRDNPPAFGRAPHKENDP